MEDQRAGAGKASAADGRRPPCFDLFETGTTLVVGVTVRGPSSIGAGPGRVSRDPKPDRGARGRCG